MIENEKNLKQFAKVCAVMAVRNTSLENLHSGKSVGSKVGDYSDVRVIGPDGDEVPWSEVSRISNDEMKSLMKEVVNRLYTIFTEMNRAQENPGFQDFLSLGMRYTADWDEPEFDKKMMPTIDYRTGEKYR